MEQQSSCCSISSWMRRLPASTTWWSSWLLLTTTEQALLTPSMLAVRAQLVVRAVLRSHGRMSSEQTSSGWREPFPKIWLWSLGWNRAWNSWRKTRKQSTPGIEPSPATSSVTLNPAPSRSNPRVMTKQGGAIGIFPVFLSEHLAVIKPYLLRPAYRGKFVNLHVLKSTFLKSRIKFLFNQNFREFWEK